MDQKPSAATATPVSDVPQVAPTSVKLSPFWAESPLLWFVQAEAQFTINRISSDVNKYFHIVSALP